MRFEFTLRDLRNAAVLAAALLGCAGLAAGAVAARALTRCR